ncbi:hypothetical protein BIW11_03058 [Tropilaelaps mercedesae]|uniref:Uncharacterized protein n=1 Tax=Tropilaelaps mercedesae TaxID=418985 RepID=A0A1V9XSQ1_9ACAR|nr:hypothetical protein BIW11_03058 [Tropilaelaps mercedesae]
MSKDDVCDRSKHSSPTPFGLVVSAASMGPQMKPNLWWKNI